METRSVHYRDIVDRLKQHRADGSYAGPLSGTKEKLAEALFRLDGVLPERNGGRKYKALSVPIEPLPLPKEIVCAEILQLLEWKDFFNFLSVSKYSRVYQETPLLWNGRLSSYSDEELEQELVVAAKHNNVAVLKGICLCGRLTSIDQRMLYQTFYAYCERRNELGARLLTQSDQLNNRVLYSTYEKMQTVHEDVADLREKIERTLVDDSLLDSTVTEIQKMIDQYTSYLTYDYLGSLITRGMNSKTFPIFSRVKGQAGKAIILGLVADESMELLRLFVTNHTLWYLTIIEVASGKMLEELGLVRKIRDSHHIADHDHWITRWPKATPLQRKLLLYHSYRTLTPQEAVVHLLQLNDADRGEVYSLLSSFSHYDGYTRWNRAFISLYELSINPCECINYEPSSDRV